MKGVIDLLKVYAYLSKFKIRKNFKRSLDRKYTSKLILVVTDGENLQFKN